MKTIDEMPGHARVWIYQASQFLTTEQQQLLSRELSEFIEQWSSHGALMDAAFAIYFDRLIVLAVDEQSASPSGCGIDKSVHKMKQLSEALGIDLFQRTAVLFQDNALWQEAPLHEFWARRKAGLVDENTLVMDTTVKTMEQMRSALVVPFGQSWHAEMWGR